MVGMSLQKPKTFFPQAQGPSPCVKSGGFHLTLGHKALGSQS